MRNKSLILFALAALLFSGFDRERGLNFVEAEHDYEFRKVSNRAFAPGERTDYVVHYGIIDAGTASLQVMDYDKQIKGRDVIKVIGKGRSQGAFDWFFKVRDHYETYIDEESIIPWLFIRDIHEGGYEFSQNYKFFQHKGIVRTQKQRNHEVPANIQDMLSAAFYARTMDLRSLNKGDVVSVMTFVDDELFDLKIRFDGRETIKIRNGKYRCLKFRPVIQTGRIFKTSEDMCVWISDDENKIPILCKTDILVGSIKVELSHYEGLSNPLAKVN